MRFADPGWLLAGLLMGIGLLGAWRWYDSRQARALARFAAPHLRRRLTGSVSTVRRRMQRGLVLGSLLGVCAALAGPELGYYWETIVRRGNEVVFALDTSRSMLTPDVKPDRLTRGKLAIDDMARELEGDGIGLVAFAGSARLVCPLTLDQGAFHAALDAVDVHTIPRGGTDLSSAITAARTALRRRPGSDRILILVTDGENLEGDPLTAAREASRQDGLKIYTVGIGTADGDRIPLPADQGGGFVKDEAGSVVKSHLDEAGLKAIAAATGGAYLRLGGHGEALGEFLRTVFGAVTKHDLAYRQRKVYIPRYQWPLAASVLMLLASLMTGSRRSRRSRATAPARAVRGARAITLGAVLAALLTPLRSESADPGTTVDGAADAKAPRVDYNAGTAAYRAGQYPAAMQAFRESIRAAPASGATRLSDQEDAYYNLGNALYRAGQQLRKSAPEDARRQWTEAVNAYDTALQLRSDDADSRYNRDFVRRQLAALPPPPEPDGGGGRGGGGGGSPNRGNGRGPPPAPGQEPSHGAPPPRNSRPAQGPPPARATAPNPAPPEASASGTAPMSAEDARALLDSAKSSEHPALLLPADPRDPAPQPDPTARNW